MVANVVCDAPRSRRTRPSGARGPVVLPRRGVFASIAGDPSSPTATAPWCSAPTTSTGSATRPTHGDECTALAVAPELLEEALGDHRGRHGTLRAPAQLRTRVLTAVARRGPVRSPSRRRRCWRSTRSAADLTGLARRGRRRRYVEEARALLAADPAAPWRLDALARRRALLAVPPRAASSGPRPARPSPGTCCACGSASRSSASAAGETSLARLAHDLGFAHHSHFSAPLPRACSPRRRARSARS